MRIEIEIPKEFECDYNEDKFKEFFSRVLCDIADGTMSGKYESEIAEMFIKAFEGSKVAYDVEAVVAAIKTRHCKKCRNILGIAGAEEYCKEMKCEIEGICEIIRNGGKE